MGVATKIQWCDHTFNPWIGCAKVSPGCEYCYAEAEQDHRYHRAKWSVHGTRHVTSDENWKKPLRWDREAREAIYCGFTLEQRQAGEHHAARPRVFCASLADVFEDRPGLEAPRARLFDLIDRTPYLDWLLLTKRPENIARFWPENPGIEEDCNGEVINLHVAGRDCDGMEGDCCWGSGWLPNLPWPVPSRSYRNNVWLGTSVEDQRRADERIPELLRVPAAVRFLSVEPLLGPIDLCQVRCTAGLDCEGAQYYNALAGRSYWSDGEFGVCGPRINWVIVGGESGPHARPCNYYWIRSIIDQCRSAGVACFVKQWGARPFYDATGGYRYDDHTYHKLPDPKGGDIDEWPEDLRIREFPR